MDCKIDNVVRWPIPVEEPSSVQNEPIKVGPEFEPAGWLTYGIDLYEKVYNKNGKEGMNYFGTVDGCTMYQGEKLILITDRNGEQSPKYDYVVELHYFVKNKDHFSHTRKLDCKQEIY